MIGDLARRGGHGAQTDARQLQLHQIADARDRCDLHLRREMGQQHLGGTSARTASTKPKSRIILASCTVATFSPWERSTSVS